MGLYKTNCLKATPEYDAYREDGTKLGLTLGSYKCIIKHLRCQEPIGNSKTDRIYPSLFNCSISSE